ncbi:MAG: chromosome partitioning protein ParB, partial [Amphritea sp.]|nr:chromosome partitioning protein ParB [Amphritea sp.]
KTLSVRQTEDLVRKLQQKKIEPEKEAKKADPLLKDLSDNLTNYLNSRVTITENAAGKGKITIAYENREKFEAILKAIQ